MSALGDLLLIDQGLVQSGGQTVGHDGLIDLHGRIVDISLRRRWPGNIGSGQGHLVPHLQFDAALQPGVVTALAGHRLTGRQVTEVLVDQLQRFAHVDVPGDGQAGVGRGIKPLKEVFDIVQIGGVQIFLGSDGHPVIRMGQRIEGFLNMPRGHSIRSVLVGLAALVLDHVALDVKTFLVQSIQQETHAIGFQPKSQVQVVGGDVFPVIGAVWGGGAVEVGASFLQRLEVAAVVVFRPFEHHMFEQVSEPGPPHLFVLGTHVVPDIYGHHGDGVVLMEYHV